VVVIGLDGASWDYIDPQIAAGRLPNLARLKREGAWGRLRSVETHYTPPAWTAMFTGRRPTKTGIYSFGSWDPRTHAFRLVDSRDVAVPAVWDVASAAGLRVAAIGVPVTYPAHPIEGVMVGGLETPKNHGPRLAFHSAEGRLPPGPPEQKSFAPPVAAALEDAHNVLFVYFLDTQDDDVTRYDRVELRALSKGPGLPETRTLGRYAFPLGAFSPWVRVRVERDGRKEDGFVRFQFQAPDGDFGFRVSPAFYRIEQPFTWPRELAGELERQFGYYLPHEFLALELVPTAARDAVTHARWFLAREDWDLFLFVFGETDNAHHLAGFGEPVLPVYAEIDAFLGELMVGQGPHTTLAVVSDHGFGAFEESVDLNQWLAGLGLLRWSRPGVIDHAQSVVFHQMWQLYFEPSLLTQDELSRRGVEIRSGEMPRQALIRFLTDAARALRAPDGRPLPIELAPLPDDAVQPAPDMTVTGYPDGVSVEFWNVQRPSGEVVTKLADADRWKHARDGIAAFYGAAVEPGDLGTLAIEDVGATLLDLLGLPVADALDGRSIAERLAPSAARRPLARVAEYPPRPPLEADAPGEGPEFEEALRALGYVED
jgi:predicted AlkP superfamily phosphohydrolase/phosphomutase